MSVAQEPPEGVTIRLMGIPWYVVAREAPDGQILLWDGQHTVAIEGRRHWRRGVIELENLRRRA